jgi:biopolymer transport protein ExbD
VVSCLCSVVSQSKAHRLQPVGFVSLKVQDSSVPIQFRCPHCKQMLSISTKRAGSMIVCPACTEEALVPDPSGATAAYDVVAVAAIPSPAAQAKPERTAPARPADSAYAEGHAHSHQLLFEDASTEESDAHEHEDEDEHHTPKPKKRFMDDTVDMTAMVDVTFLLLIFFMVTASFAAQKVFETSPPEQEGEGGGAAVSSMEDLESNSVVLEIDANDQMEIEGQPIAGLYELRETLQAKMSEDKNELLIQAQYQATHGMVVSVTDVAMDVGMQKVRRISRKADE